MNEKTFIITREKHLDHLVRVVPLIVLGYAVQCYFLSRHYEVLGTSAIAFLGLALGLMIGGFILHDIKYQAELNEEGLYLRFYLFNRLIPYEQIQSTEVIDGEESFGAVIFRTERQGKITLYFVDEPAKIKAWIDSKKANSFSLAA